MDIISIIVIIAIISKIIKKGKEEGRRIQKNTTPYNPWQQIKEMQNQTRQYTSTDTEKWRSLARQNIEKARQRAVEKQNKSAIKQVDDGRMEVRNTSIFQRAMENTEADKEDITLQMMETEHNHSERVAPAEHYHPEEPGSDSMLGSIEDLMIKGYDGNLCFERDFVAEALDMMNRFTVPSDIPDVTL